MNETVTLGEAIRRGAAEHPETPFVFVSDVRPRETTVGGLVADAEQVASAYRSLGIEPGDVIAVQLPNWYENAVAQAAAGLLGAVLLPVVQVYGPHELGFILRQSGAKLLIIPGTWRKRYYPDMLGEIHGIPDLLTVVVDDTAPAGSITWDELRQRGTGTFEAVDAAPSDLALLVYTSGTTADPKGVQHSHATLLAEVFSSIRRTAADGQMTLGLFPPGHVAGLLGLLRVLVLGNATVTMDVWDTPRVAGLIDIHQVTYVSGAPIHLSGLLDARDRGDVTFATLREFLVGAASVAPALVERADRAGICAFRCYGSSEHPTISAGQADDPLEKRATTDGRLIEGNEVRLVDDAGNDVPAGDEGEIVTRGPELFVGYRDQALDASSFLEGRWYLTGDIGVMDGDGYLTITDRKKDIIIRGGENISSKEVEDVLATHPAVAEAAAIGAPDEAYGERVAAFVVAKPGFTFDFAMMSAHFATAGMAKAKTPEYLHLVDELPRTASGKIQKFVLREQLPSVDR